MLSRARQGGWRWGVPGGCSASQLLTDENLWFHLTSCFVALSFDIATSGGKFVPYVIERESSQVAQEKVLCFQVSLRLVPGEAKVKVV